MELPSDEIDAIVAGIASSLILSGGLFLAHVSGGVTVVLASVVLSSAGGTGLARSIKGYIEGRFDWTECVTDSLITAGVSIITFGAGYLLSCGVTSLCLKHAISLSTDAIQNITAATGAISGSVIQGSACALISHIKGDEIETFELILECAAGAIVGTKAAKLAFNGQLKLFSRGSSNWKASAYKSRPCVVKGETGAVRVFGSPGPVVGSDLNSIQTPVRNATRSKLLILSGTHGTSTGDTVLDKIGLKETSFFDADCERVGNLFSGDFFRGRTVVVINLADFRGPGDLFHELVRQEADTIVGAFCYAEQAMKDGQLGSIIRDAVKAYPAVLP